MGALSDWPGEASRLLRAKLVESGVTYAELALRLQALGVAESERSIANKLSRGSFQFAFFLQCMKALGRESVTLELGLTGRK